MRKTRALFIWEPRRQHLQSLWRWVCRLMPSRHFVIHARLRNRYGEHRSDIVARNLSVAINMICERDETFAFIIAQAYRPNDNIGHAGILEMCVGNVLGFEIVPHAVRPLRGIVRSDRAQHDKTRYFSTCRRIYQRHGAIAVDLVRHVLAGIAARTGSKDDGIDVVCDILVQICQVGHAYFTTLGQNTRVRTLPRHGDGCVASVRKFLHQACACITCRACNENSHIVSPVSLMS